MILNFRAKIFTPKEEVLVCTSGVHVWALPYFLPQMQSTEEGLLQAEELVHRFTYCCSWFIGPFYHLLRVFHPDYVKPLLMASGTAPAAWHFSLFWLKSSVCSCCLCRQHHGERRARL